MYGDDCWVKEVRFYGVLQYDYVLFYAATLLLKSVTFQKNTEEPV